MANSSFTRIALAGAATAWLATCTPVCACSPAPRSQAVFFGIVTAGATPVADASVTLAGSAPACGAAVPPPFISFPYSGTSSRPNGTYHLRVLAYDRPGPYCVRLKAVAELRGAADSVVVSGLTVEFRRLEQNDSTRLDFAFDQPAPGSRR